MNSTHTNLTWNAQTSRLCWNCVKNPIKHPFKIKYIRNSVECSLNASDAMALHTSIDCIHIIILNTNTKCCLMWACQSSRVPFVPCPLYTGDFSLKSYSLLLPYCSSLAFACSFARWQLEHAKTNMCPLHSSFPISLVFLFECTRSTILLFCRFRFFPTLVPRHQKTPELSLYSKSAKHRTLSCIIICMHETNLKREEVDNLEIRHL